MYIYRDNSNNPIVHIWNGEDTECRMWSTGGLSKNTVWVKTESRGEMKICTMCQNNQKMVKNKKSKKRRNRKQKPEQIKVKTTTIDFYSTDAWRELRYQALKNNNGSCELCGATRHDGVKLHVDHIKPRSKYPELELELSNLQVLCDSCNLGKSNKHEDDWRQNDKVFISKAEKTAIACLLHDTSLAVQVGENDIVGLSKNGANLLSQIIELLHKRPESTVAMILGHWYGTPGGKRLTDLSNWEPLTTKKDRKELFIDILNSIIDVPLHNDLADQVDKLKCSNYAEVTEKEKQKMRELLAEKQKRDLKRRNI